MRLTLTFLLLCYTLLGTSLNAYAKTLKICNHTSYKMNISFVKQNKNITQTQGWMDLLPGNCRNTEEFWGKVKNTDTLFIYARSDSGYSDAGQVFSGKHTFCIQPYSNYQTKIRTDCYQNNLSQANFIAIHKDKQHENIILSTPEDYTQHSARIVAVQRLLKNMGYDIDLIDGVSGKKTRVAIAHFQKENRLKQNQKINNTLLKKLYVAMKTKNQQHGLHLCNRTTTPIWSSVGWETPKHLITQGWIFIKSNQCIQAHNQTGVTSYFYYAETLNKNKKWSGNSSLCTQATQFHITEHENCIERGLARTEFISTTINNTAKKVVNFD